ncbi:MAG: thioredoxin TrxA [Candidatus Sumerlaeia bacterium]
MGSNKVAVFTDDNFEQEVLKSQVPVLVDFWAPWCGPCLRLAPTIEELAAEYEGRLKVGKINVDDYQTYAQEYGVQSIPTLFIFKNGQPVERIVGAVPKASIAAKIESAVE